MQDHRKPPKPKYYDSAKSGTCRYCGWPIFKKNSTEVNKRASWHPDCVEEYKIIYWPKETRKAVWKRDKGLCQECGSACDKKSWEMDHLKPLVEANGNITYWMLSNCRTLCKPCHRVKTSKENSDRAKEKSKLK